MYKGRYDAPTSQPPVVKETGAYTGEVAAKYNELAKKLEDSGAKLVQFVNAAWPQYKPAPGGFTTYPDKIKEASKEHQDILKDIDTLRTMIQKIVVKRFLA